MASERWEGVGGKGERNEVGKEEEGTKGAVDGVRPFGGIGGEKEGVANEVRVGEVVVRMGAQTKGVGEGREEREGD